MIPSIQDEHEGWKIHTACWEENPPDWTPGNPSDPCMYCASGFAEFAKPNVYRGSWLSKLRLTVPAKKDMLFTDFNAAHAAVAETLRASIDALKVP